MYTNIISITVRMTRLDIPDNQINDLFRDSQGRLWVVTVNGTSLYTDKDNFQNIPLDFPNKKRHPNTREQRRKDFSET